MSAENLLLIQTDEWPGYLLGGNGRSPVMTPTLDALAEEGIRFTNCQSSCPVCIPARRSLMTGTFPSTHGDRVYSDHMEMPEAETLAEAFRKKGYQTYAVGKLHVYPQRNRIGFDDVILMEEGRYEMGSIDDYQIWLGETGYIGEEFSHAMGNNTYYTRPWHLPDNTHPTVWATDQMCRTIMRRDPTRPFFFYMSYQFPHPPLVPLQSYLDMYSFDEIELPDLDKDDWKDRYDILRFFTEDGKAYSDKEKKMALRAFYAQCTLIDHQIRRLVGTLRENGLLDNTVIGFISDHGDMLFNHGMVAKRVFYQESSNVPFILSGKPLEKYRGTSTDKLCALEDIMPTLLNIFDIPVPETVEGVDILSSEREMLFGEISEGVKATRMATDGRYKLIYYPYGNVKQLFDLENDPEEHHDLGNKAEYKAIQEKLEAYLVAHLHGKEDLSWVKNGKLVGYPEDGRAIPFGYGLSNQRGLHWPIPSEYKNTK